MNKIWQLLSSFLILVCSIGSIKINSQPQIEIKQDNFKTNNEQIDLETIKFQTLTFNFSQFTTINELRKWIFQDINQTFEFYKISLDYITDYDVKPVDDGTLKQFLTTSENYNYNLLITIYAQEKSIKAINNTTLELINDLNAEGVPLEPPLPTLEPNKPLPVVKKQNLIIMTSISILVISFLIIIIFLKARFKKGIGVKKSKNTKNSYYSGNKNKTKNLKKEKENNKVIKLSLEEKHIIKMNNKIEKYQIKIEKRKKKTKKAKKKKKKNYYQI